MKAELRDIFSTTLPIAFASMPDDLADCWVDIIADIGVVGEEGSDAFTFQVCTIGRLKKIIERSQYLIESNLIIVGEFDWELVEAAIKSALEKIEANNWGELAAKIHELGKWEYQNLQDVSVDNE